MVDFTFIVLKGSVFLPIKAASGSEADYSNRKEGFSPEGKHASSQASALP